MEKTSSHYIDSPLDSKWNLADVIGGKYKGELVNIIVQFSCGKCVVDFGTCGGIYDDKIDIIDSDNLDFWKNVEKVIS